MRIAFTSDLHTDLHPSNRLVWQEMVATLHEKPPDVFICCGDVAADEQQFGLTLFALEGLPCPKLLVPGNHDLWLCNSKLVRQGVSSQDKYYRLLPALCRAAGFHPLWLEPYVLGDIAFCGTTGWYDYSLRNPAFDGQISRQDYQRKIFQRRIWNDKRHLYWLLPQANGAPRQHLPDEALSAGMIRELLQQLHHARQQASRLVVVTHMVPFRAMVHYHQEPGRDYFTAFMGSAALGEALHAFPKVELVLCGHIHRPVSLQIAHISARTSPLGYAWQWPETTPITMARQRLGVVELP